MTSAQSATRTIVCIHEDRPSCMPGAKLTALSMRDHYPQLEVVISCPNPSPAFEDWIEQQAGIRLLHTPELTDCGFNIKPRLLLRQLDEGYDNVIWVDSDIVAIRPLATRLDVHAPDVFVATQETYWGQQQGGTKRTIDWGLTPGRDMPVTVNSGILRVTEHHRELLNAWQQMLAHPTYRAVQKMPWYERPLHMITDQEVLTGLLGSGQFADVPLLLLQRGRDIAQCFGPSGFTPLERMRCIAADMPAFVHAMGPKPWDRSALLAVIGEEPSMLKLRRYYENVALELSPYFALAPRYREALAGDDDWMHRRSNVARFLSALTGNHPILQGMPLAMFDSTIRVLRRELGMGRIQDRAEFVLTESPLVP
jgi:hypothetical protein